MPEEQTVPTTEPTTLPPGFTVTRGERSYGVGAGYEISKLSQFRTVFPEYDKYSDEQLLKAWRDKYKAYYDVDDDRLAAGIEAKFKPIYDQIMTEPEQEKPPGRRWYNQPIMDLPNWVGMKLPREMSDQDIDDVLGVGGFSMPIKRAMYGSIYGFYESLNELTTPVNLGLMVVTAGAYPLIKKGYHVARIGSSITSLIFAAKMGKELPAQYNHLKDMIEAAGDDPTAWGEVGREAARLAFGATMTFAAAKHGFKEMKTEVGVMKGLKEMGYRATMRATPEKLNDLRLDFLQEQARKTAELEEIVGTGREFHYENINELQQRVQGLEELSKAKLELDKFEKNTAGIEKQSESLSEEFKEGEAENQLPKPYKAPEIPVAVPTQANVRNRTMVLAEAAKRGLVDDAGNGSFEFMRLLDMFDVENINQLKTPQLRKLNTIVKRLPKNYADVQAKLDTYYHRLNRSIFSPDIARIIVGEKEMVDVSLPYDENYDYVYNNRLKTFEKEKVVPKSKVDYEYITRQSRIKFGDRGKRILDEITDGQLKRFSGDDLRILRNRFDRANPNYIPEELQDFLSNGEEVFTYSENHPGTRYDWLHSAIAQSAYRFFDKVGMGNEFRNAVQNKRLTDITMVNTYTRMLEETFKPIVNNPIKMKTYSELALRYRSEGLAAFAAYPEFLPMIERVRAIFKEIGDLSVEHNVEVFNPLFGPKGRKEPFSDHFDPNYQPNIYDPSKVAKMRKSDKLYEDIKRTTGLTDPREVNAIVNNIIANRKGYRQGNLENVRLVDEPGWLGDPRSPDWKPGDILRGYEYYINGAIDRITSLKFFEGEGTGGIDLYGKYINKMSRWNRDIALKYMSRVRGMDKNGYFNDWAAAIRNVQLMRKLNLSPIANAFQVSITSLPKYSLIGYRRMVVDLARNAFPIIRSMKHNDLASLGIDMAHAMEALTGIQGRNNLNGIARKWLKANMFSTTEFFNRAFSYHMGTSYVKRMIDMLHGRDRGLFGMEHVWQSPRGRKQLIAELQKMGISDRAIDMGVLTPEDLHRAGYRFSMETQFGMMAENLPFAWSSPWGKVVTQFKSFTFNMARFGKDMLIKPILKNPTNMNSWKPLLTWLAAANLSGETVSYVRSQALKHVFGLERKKPKPDDPFVRGLENTIAISPFGLGWEVWQSINYGDFWGNVAGPTGADVEDIALDIVQRGRLPVERVMPYPLDRAVQRLIREK